MSMIASTDAMASTLATKGSMDEFFKSLELANVKVAQELKQLIYEQYGEVKEPWLVHGLYDMFYTTKSLRCLELLLNVKEPHERFLCDKISESLKQGGESRAVGLNVLGYVIRRQPSWLYRITQHSLMKDFLRVLKHEEDVVPLMSALFDLLAMLPILPAHIAPYLNDIFEVFSRVASWCLMVKDLPEMHKAHVQVALHACFQRLYGMYPCNFLSYLRTQYSEGVKENRSVFERAISPMLASVRVHPSLVVHSREQEKTSNRWNRMELHEVVAEFSRYSLIAQDSNNLEQKTVPKSHNFEFGCAFNYDISSDVQKILEKVTTLQGSLWTPSRACCLTTPPSGASSDNIPHAAVTSSPEAFLYPREILDSSPPEPAIEATPETTPFVTPSKDDMLRFNRPAPSRQTSRQLRLDIRSPSLLGAGGGQLKGSAAGSLPKRQTSSSTPLHPAAGDGCSRRDSLFERTAVGGATPSHTSLIVTSTAFLAAAGETTINTDESTDRKRLSNKVKNSSLVNGNQQRPSPVKFTNERPEQFPIKPKPERFPPNGSEAVKLSLDNLKNLKDALPDFGKEEDDDEVTKLTGGTDSANKDNMTTRHITPQICLDSAATSRTTSRLSSSSQTENTVVKTSLSTPTKTTSILESGRDNTCVAHVHDAIKIESRSTCIPSRIVGGEPYQLSNVSKRRDSCPDLRSLEIPQRSLDGELVGVCDAQTSVVRLETKGVQTLDDFAFFPYEHLFPLVLPHNTKNEGDVSDNPYDILDKFVKAACDTALAGPSCDIEVQKMLKNEIALLHNMVLYERHRREILDLRNRRLLGKSMSSAILEEDFRVLNESLRNMKSQIATLFDNLKSVRREKHDVEEERAANAKQRDKEMERLVREGNQFKQKNQELQEKLSDQTEKSKLAQMEIERLQASLFNASSEVDRLRRKEEARQVAEKEVGNLRQQVLLLGELLRRYREKIDLPGNIDQEQERIIVTYYEREIANATNLASIKVSEAEAYKGKVHDLEQSICKKDRIIFELKDLLKKVEADYASEDRAREAAYDALTTTNVQLEGKILELYDQLTKATRYSRRQGRVSTSSAGLTRSTNTPTTPPGYGEVLGNFSMSGSSGLASSGRGGVSTIHSAYRDIPATSSSHLSNLSEKASFVVGSPPSSTESVESEVIRRALESGGAIYTESESGVSGQTGERRTVSPEIESAISAKESSFDSSEDSNNIKSGNNDKP